MLYKKIYPRSKKAVEVLKAYAVGGEFKGGISGFEEFVNIGVLFFNKSWGSVVSNIDACLELESGWLSEYLCHVRAEALIKRAVKDKYSLRYDDLLVSNIPFELRFYIEGLYYYFNGHSAEAYRLFEISRFASFSFINSGRQFVDSSIRGVNSAISYETLKKLPVLFESLDFSCLGFSIKKTPCSGNATMHIIGCDENYFNKFFRFFYENFQSLFHGGRDLWLHISNPSKETLDYIGSIEDSSFGYSIDSVEYNNIKTYYTEMRFIFSYEILRFVSYEKIIMSDVDAILDLEAYEHLLCFHEDLVIKKTDRSPYPWRSVAAGFVVMNVNNEEVREKILGNIARHFFYVYLPDVGPRGNKQWWIDQFSLSIIADAILNKVDGFNNLSIKRIDGSQLPLYTAGDFELSKEDFARDYFHVRPSR